MLNASLYCGYCSVLVLRFVSMRGRSWPGAEKSGIEIYTSRTTALWPKAIIEDPILGDPVSSINFPLDRIIQKGKTGSRIVKKFVVMPIGSIRIWAWYRAPPVTAWLKNF
jgi:hypothetical protein